MRVRWLIVLLGLSIALGSSAARAQNSETWKGQYLEPRFPSYVKQPKTVDDLMPKARAFVRVIKGNQGYGMGNFKAGDTLLIVPDVTAEPLTLEAVRRALEERGIKVMIRSEAEMVGLSREDAETYRKLTVIPSAKVGYLEARNYWLIETPRVWPNPEIPKEWLRKRRPDIYDALFPKDQQVPPEFKAKAEKLYSKGVGTAIREYLEKHPEITALYWRKQGAGFSGPRALGSQGKA